MGLQNAIGGEGYGWYILITPVIQGPYQFTMEVVDILKSILIGTSIISTMFLRYEISIHIIQETIQAPGFMQIKKKHADYPRDNPGEILLEWLWLSKEFANYFPLKSALFEVGQLQG